MKGLIISDLHIQPENAGIVRDALDSSFKIASAKKINDVFIAGDVFNRHSLAPKTTSTGTMLDAFIGPVGAFLRENSANKVWIIRGNHDMAPPGCEDILAPVSRVIDRLYYFSEPFIANVNGVSVCFLPWMSKRAMGDEAFGMTLGNYLEAVRATEGPKVLIGHFDICGARVSEKFSIVGGEFELTRGDLAALDLSSCFVGHIHKKQSIEIGECLDAMHLGALVQHNHGETGNPTGATVFEVTSRGSALSVFYPIRSREFFTIDMDEPTIGPEIDGASKEDIIRVLGTGDEAKDREDLDKYDPAMIYSYHPKPVEAEIRRPDALEVTPDMDAGELFGAWLTGNEATQEVVDKASEFLVDHLREHQPKLGTLERIRSVLLQNIGPHRVTEVKFKDGINAITGAVGAGKTFVLEAIVAAAFGFFPSRPSKLSDRITWGSLGRGQITVDAECRGDRIVFQREVDNSNAKPIHNAYTLGSRFSINSGKPTETNLYNQRLLGDPALFLSTVFTSQGHAKDLVNSDPADRKKILASLLGHDYLAEIQKKAASDLFPLVTERSILESEAEKFDAIIAEEEGTRNALEAVNESIEIAEGHEREAEIVVQTTAGDIQDGTLVLSEIVNKKARLANLVASHEGVLKTLNAKRDSLEEITKLVAEEPIIKQKADEYRASHDKLEERAEILEMLSKARVERETAKRKLEGFKARREAQEKALEVGIAKSEALIKTIEREVARRVSEARVLENPDCQHEVCVNCPALHNLRLSKDKIKDLEKEIEEISQSIEKHRAKLDEVIAWDNEEESRLEEDLREKNSEKHAFTRAVDAEKFLTAERIVKENAKYLALEGQIYGTKELKKEIEINLAELEDRADGLDREMKMIEDEIDVQSPEIIEENLATARIKNTEARRLLVIARDRLEALHQSKGRQEQALENIKAAWRGKADHLNRRAEILQEEAALSLLVEAFGKNGIPQHLIDAALPEIHKALDFVMMKIGLGFRIRLVTQDETQKGRLVEVLRIEITNPDGHVKEIGEYSGGEQKMIKVSLRIALALFQARISGQGHKVLLADEVFDGLNEDRSEAILAALEGLSEEFNQVILSTHNQSIIAGVENIIEINCK